MDWTRGNTALSLPPSHPHDMSILWQPYSVKRYVNTDTIPTRIATVSTQYVNVVAAVFETLPGTTYLKALPPQKEQNSCSIFTKCQKHPNGYYDGISRNISVFKEQIKMHATLKQPNCSR